ncbi:MAG: hypothetical protein H0U74_13750 [Bradymonadaceae bacterium]|nr:hypothetical protein [Lujinxingiaceae bacterium]
MLKKSFIMVVFGLLAACSAEETLPQIVDDVTSIEEERRVGSLLAQFKHPRGERDEGLTVHAQFLDVRGVQLDSALESLEVWTPDVHLDVASCSLRTPARYASTAGADQFRLDLLDVGRIRVEGPAQSIELEARRLPDLLSAFSGVIYGTEQGFGERRLLDYAPASSYRFSAPGYGVTGGFSVEMFAPEPLHIAEVSRRDVRYHSTARLTLGSDIELGWNMADSGERADIFIDVSTGYGPDRARLKCRAEDDGFFTIPAGMLDQLLDETATLEVSMRRVHTLNVDIKGLDVSEFIIATTDEITVVFD